MPLSCLLVLFASQFLGSDALRVARAPSQDYTFDAFVEEFHRTYQRGTDEWAWREALFTRKLQEIRAFATGPQQSWEKGVTRFMDYTDTEFKAVLGYRGSGSRSTPPAGAVELRERSGQRAVPAPHSFQTNNSALGAVVRDQGACGSCWAEAATTVLEGHMQSSTAVFAALKAAVGDAQQLPTLASQAVVSCTENPRHCGGTGGCQGATSELAFEMVKKQGLPLAVEWPYTSGTGSTPACKTSIFSKIRLGITGYTVLPSNKLHPLKKALADIGAPIVVSVDATNWQLYVGGIFSDTSMGGKGDFNVNHAVSLVGYKDPQGNEPGYWRIKNSWGEWWGEEGHIRLEMKANEEEHCGWDYNTHEGLACDGDPDSAWVCGTCGVLYDSSFPTGIHLLDA